MLIFLGITIFYTFLFSTGQVMNEPGIMSQNIISNEHQFDVQGERYNLYLEISNSQYLYENLNFATKIQ